MATHCSILAWRITWTEEHGGLQSIGSQKVGPDLSDLSHMHARKGYLKNKITKMTLVYPT